MSWETEDGRDELNGLYRNVRLNPALYIFPVLIAFGLWMASKNGADVGYQAGIVAELAIVTGLVVVTILGRGWLCAPLLTLLYVAEVAYKYFSMETMPNRGWVIFHFGIGALLLGAAYQSVRIRELKRKGVTRA